ncbi:MAG: hypothetical protein ACRBB3_01715 [Alphaproteobacteria bacterium]
MTRLILFVFIAVSTLAQMLKAEETSYFDFDIPVLDGGKNISRSKSDTNYSVSLSYEVVVERPDLVYDFYNEFFQNHGWGGLMMGSAVSEKWSGFSANINGEGKAVFSNSAMWQPKETPVLGLVSLIVNDYKEEKFYAEVHVDLNPEINNDNFFEFSKSLDNPRNIFILQKAIGADPFQLENMKPNLIIKEYEGEAIIEAYMKMAEKTLYLYQDFGEQYVHKSKPVDGKFKQNFPSNFGDLTSSEADAEMSQDDPLDRWRLLQEKRDEVEHPMPTECNK